MAQSWPAGLVYKLHQNQSKPWGLNTVTRKMDALLSRYWLWGTTARHRDLQGHGEDQEQQQKR